jgi:putative endonuclease
MYTVYIVYSERFARHYSGMSTHLRKRLKKHRSGQTPSVPASEDWTVVWSRCVATAAEARVLEKRIKARGARRFLEDQAE